MQTMGLDAEEFAAYLAALERTNVVGARVEVVNLDEEHLDTISHKLLPGSQVNVNANADVTRALELVVWDPHRTLGLDTTDPSDGALYLDRMLRVHYLIRVPQLGRVVAVPVFVGPIVPGGVVRTGPVVELSAHGKEELARHPIWNTLDIPPRTLKTTAVKRILRDGYGETRFDIPATTAKLPKERSLGTWDIGWTVARNISGSMSRQLYYPGTGVCTMRPRPGPSKLAFTFTSAHYIGDTPVSFGDQIFNTVRVVGKGKKARHTAHAPADHPLSAVKLGRKKANGVVVPRRLAPDPVEDDSIGSKKEARQRAVQLLNDYLAAAVKVEFQSIPIPHLDEGDWVALETPEWRHEFRLDEFVIPLHTDGDPTSSIGYLKPAPVADLVRSLR